MRGGSGTHYDQMIIAMCWCKNDINNSIANSLESRHKGSIDNKPSMAQA